MTPEQEAIVARVRAVVPAEATIKAYDSEPNRIIILGPARWGAVTLLLRERAWAPGGTYRPWRDPEWMGIPTRGFRGNGWVEKMARAAWSALAKANEPKASS